MKKFKEILIKLNAWKFIILIVLIISGAFYWSEIRPNMDKRYCYNEARKKAIEKSREEKAKPYLYDRENWKNYKTYSSANNPNSSFWEPSLNSMPTFSNNLSTGIEPTYIQENLDRIAKEEEASKDDYDLYYKMCLQSKGL